MDRFSNIEELYKRVEPALNSKVKDFTRIGVTYIQKADIWNYLKNNLWCKKKDLTLGELVNDIMTVPNHEIERYVQDLMSKGKRKREEDNFL